jgi:ADP-heptose:LPS heptosyltransferase
MLKEQRFDYIVDLHKNLRSFKVRMALGVKTFSFNKINLQKWLFVNFKINRLPDTHIVKRYLDAAVSLGVRDDNMGLDFFLSEKSMSEAWTFLKNTGLSPLEYNVVVIGAAHATKVPREAWFAHLLDDLPEATILVGGPAELGLGERLAHIHVGKVWNAAGQLSVGASAAVIKGASVVISPDTGMMHIAAAFQRKIISLWGNTVPSFGMYPYFGDNGKGSNVFVENKILTCRPCSKIGYANCPKGHFHCMEKLPIQEVSEQLNQLKKDFDA